MKLMYNYVPNPYTEHVQIPTRIPEKIVVALFSGILVNCGILVDYTVVIFKLFKSKTSRNVGSEKIKTLPVH